MPNENERYWLQKCIESFRNNDHEGLLKNADELEKVSEDKFTPTMYRGIAYYHKKMFEDAQKIFYSIYLKKLVKERKEDDNLLYYLSLCDIYTNKLDRAIDLLTKLEEKYPKNIDYKIMLYLAFNLKGDFVSSSFELSEALATDEKSTVKTLEEMLLVALEHSELSGTAKVLLVEMVRKLRKR